MGRSRKTISNATKKHKVGPEIIDGMAYWYSAVEDKWFTYWEMSKDSSYEDGVGNKSKARSINEVYRRKSNDPDLAIARSAINNHKARGYPLLASEEEIVQLFRDAVVCPDSGVRFENKVQSGWNPLVSKSIDVIDPTKPPTLDNLRVISTASNSAKNKFSMDEYRAFVEMLYRTMILKEKEMI